MAVTRADGADFDAKLAGSDLSSSVHLVCKYGSDGTVGLTGAITDWPAGIITEGGVSGAPVTFQTSGLGKCKAGAAIAAGARVMATAAGKVITQAGATSIGFGVARSAVNADGEIVEVYIDRSRGAA